MSKTASNKVGNTTELSEIRAMQRFLTKAFATARITVDEPLAKNGVHALDLFLQDYHVGVAWQKGKGFGIVSNDAHAYGEGAHEVYETRESALSRIVQLVSNRLPTISPESVRLKELRELRCLSQEEVARRLGTKQASISRTEARSDYLLSTLNKYAEALGAKLVVKIVFPDAEMELKLEEEK